ncbi:MAG: 50S ribosomal protein L23 [Patescibacteria group bacterium]
MKLNPFSKSEPKVKTPAKEADVSVRATAPLEKASASLLENIYVSEKASRLQAEDNTFVFRVADTATKSEVSKAIEKRYGVKVSKVRVISSPRKRRDTGRFPGYKAGFKKALVTLEKGQTITQAQP